MFVNPEFAFKYLKSKDFLQDYANHCTHYHEVNHANLHSFAPLQYFDLKSFTLKTAISHSQQFFENFDFHHLYTDQILTLALLVSEDDLLLESLHVRRYSNQLSCSSFYRTYFRFDFLHFDSLNSTLINYLESSDSKKCYFPKSKLGSDLE